MPSTPLTRHSPWVIWGVGAGVYFFGLIHRASLGVAGPTAVTHLGLSATQLGTFIMVQLGLYAIMQVPAGMAIDRWGARRVLLTSTLAMGAAQMMFAFAASYPLALLARALLGVGDAAVFIAVLRLAAVHFPRRRYATMTMLTGLTGMLGNLIATVPLVIALNTWGWTTTFLLAGATSLAYSLLLLRPVVRTASEPTAPPEFIPKLAIGFAAVAAVWARPEVRLGFWTHLTTLTPGLVLSMLWGFPYLTEGLGYSDAGAAAILSLYIGVNVLAGFIVPTLAGRKPPWRVALAFGVAGACLLALTGMVLWPGGAPPLWYMLVVFALAATGAPTSQIGFHLTRDYNPAESMSTATGLVNAGGFLGAMGVSVGLGAVLDALGGGSPALADYRWAMSVLTVFTFAALVTMTISLLGVRRRAFERLREGQAVVVEPTERPWDRAFRRITGR